MNRTDHLLEKKTFAFEFKHENNLTSQNLFKSNVLVQKQHGLSIQNGDISRLIENMRIVENRTESSFK